MTQTQAPKFEFTGGRLCLDFVNTVDNRNSPSRVDQIGTYDNLLAWAQQAAIVSTEQAQALRKAAHNNPRDEQTATMHAVALRECMFAIFAAIARGQPASSSYLERFNRTLRDAGGSRGLVSEGGRFRWKWITPPGHLEWILWPIVLDAAELLLSQDLSLMRECAAQTCGWLFVDHSKNHRRRWCDMKVCGNRDKARRYYARARAD
ncbi:MAG TPA: ABATE domain-containing protein [Terriglobales bacterium]|nr:ABATE domain-containing protein [Terriglobales bacterium]